MKFVTIILFALIGLFAMPACTNTATVDPAGTYKGDAYLYQTDQAVGAAFNLFQVYVTWEYNNRAVLASNPEIKKSADYIRSNVKQWRDSALALRDAYAATPSADNKANLNKVLAVIQAALVQATAYMTSPTATTTPPPNP